MDIQIHPENVVSNVVATSSVSLGVRNYMSIGMLRTAKKFAERAQDIEDAHEGVWASPHVEEHMDYVVASLISTASFLEAMINEIFTDVAENQDTKDGVYLGSLDGKARKLMGDWWDETREGFDRTLTKYQLLLAFAGKERLSVGAEPYQSASLLIQLRNILVHYRPETIYTDKPHKIQAKLQGRFVDNKLTSSKGNWWPSRALGAGCAKWAHDSAELFADEVAQRVGIRPRYVAVREGTKSVENR